MRKYIYGIVSVILTITFICQDIGWAGQALSSSHDTLQPSSQLQDIQTSFGEKCAAKEPLTRADRRAVDTALAGVPDPKVRRMVGEIVGLDLSKIPPNPHMKIANEAIDLKTIIANVVKTLLAQPLLAQEIEKIYVMGSVAKGMASTAKEEPSDIDLFIKFKNLPKRGDDFGPYYSKIQQLHSVLMKVRDSIFDHSSVFIDLLSNAVVNPEFDSDADDVEWEIALKFEDDADVKEDRVLIYSAGANGLTKTDSATLKAPGGDSLDEDSRENCESEIAKCGFREEEASKIQEAIDLIAGEKPSLDRISFRVVSSEQLGIPRFKGAAKPQDLVYAYGKTSVERIAGSVEKKKLHIYVTIAFWKMLQAEPKMLAFLIDHEYQENIVLKNKTPKKRHAIASKRAWMPEFTDEIGMNSFYRFYIDLFGEEGIGFLHRNLEYKPHKNDPGDIFKMYVLLAFLENMLKRNESFDIDRLDSSIACSGIRDMAITKPEIITYRTIKVLEDAIKENRLKKERVFALIIEPLMLTNPAVIIAAVLNNGQSVFRDCEGFKYLFYYAYLLGFDLEEDADLSSLFPLQNKFRELAAEGPKKVLIVHNINDGLGDELVRNGILLKALLAYNPELQITIYTNRGFLYSHPRIKTENIHDYQPNDYKRFDIVIYHHEDAARYRYNPNIFLGNLEPSPGRICVTSVKDNDRFFYGGSINTDSARMPFYSGRRVNVHTHLYHLCAEYGLLSGEKPEENPFTGIPNETADKYWREEIESKNISNRPIVIVNGFGGEAEGKGFRNIQGDKLEFVQLIKDVIAKGYFVIILPNHQPWGSRDAVNEIFGLLSNTERENAVAGPAPNENSLPYKYLVDRADMILTVEGGLMHLGYIMHKDTKVLGPDSSFGIYTPLWYPFSSDLKTPKRPELITDIKRDLAPAGEGTTALAEELGISVEALNLLLSDLGDAEASDNLRGKFIRLIKKDGKITEDEVGVLVKNIELVRQVLEKLLAGMSDTNRRTAIERLATYLSIEHAGRQKPQTAADPLPRAGRYPDVSDGARNPMAQSA